MELSKNLLSVLACPECHGKLEFNRGKLKCPKCRQVFRVIDNVPILFTKDNEK
jgi:uncharacterized protein YbaR (Trm112 family)